jgi:predicted MPP superfamily phosphohydrolase
MPDTCLSPASDETPPVILLAHDPECRWNLRKYKWDLLLSGHTHGGQVSLFGIYTPFKNSAYGSRFLRGRNRTTGGVDVITTNGVGTSRRKVRFCVPSEIVVVTLLRQHR